MSFFPYIGFDAVSTAAEEAKHPQRDLSIAILGSLWFCLLLYMAVAAVLTGSIPIDQIDIHAPVADALKQIGYSWGAILVGMGALAGITSVLFVMMLGQIRLLFAMARDGLLSPKLAEIHPTYHTHSWATLGTGCGVALLAGFIPIGEAADMTNIGTLFAFFTVCLGVLWLWIINPQQPRSVRLPMMPVIPLLGAASCVVLMLFLPIITWIRFAECGR